MLCNMIIGKHQKHLIQEARWLRFVSAAFLFQVPIDDNADFILFVALRVCA